MIRLIKLEMRKINFLQMVVETILINIMLLFFIIIFDYISVKNNSTFINSTTVNLFITVPFIMYASVLISRVIIEEYESKTMYILFLYNINRIKLIVSKSFLIVIIIFVLINISKVLLFWSTNILEVIFINFQNTVYSLFKEENFWNSNMFIIGTSIATLTPVYFAVKRKLFNGIILGEFILVIILCSANFLVGPSILLRILFFFDIVAIVAIVRTLKEIKTHCFEDDIYFIDRCVEIKKE